MSGYNPFNCDIIKEAQEAKTWTPGILIKNIKNDMIIKCFGYDDSSQNYKSCKNCKYNKNLDNI